MKNVNGRNASIISLVTCFVVFTAVMLFMMHDSSGGKTAVPAQRDNPGRSEPPKCGTEEKDGAHGNDDAMETAPGTDGATPRETADDAPDAPEKPSAAAEAREREESRLVDAFDALADKWTSPSQNGVSMNDIDDFTDRFRSLPAARRRECLHRALNLVPDENVMILAGILMDKSQDKETVETVFNNILNRGDDVKKPILQQLFKDREHPCWADTAWILDITGELPKKEK